MMIGYARVSKADGTQALDLQKDALIQAGVDSQHIYEDFISGKQTVRPGLDAVYLAAEQHRPEPERWVLLCIDPIR